MVLTGYGSIRNALSLIQAGAVEYLTKPVGLDELEIGIRRELDSTELRQRNEFYTQIGRLTPPGPAGLAMLRQFDKNITPDEMLRQVDK